MADITREFDVTAEDRDYLVTVTYEDDHGRLLSPATSQVVVHVYADDWTAETPVEERTRSVAWASLPAAVQQVILTEIDEQAREAERDRDEQERLADEAAYDAHIDRLIDVRRGR